VNEHVMTCSQIKRWIIRHTRRLYSCHNSAAVNFINILHTNFSYERHFGSFSLVTFWLWGEILTKIFRVKHWWNWRQESHISLGRKKFWYLGETKAKTTAITTAAATCTGNKTNTERSSWAGIPNFFDQL